jgi:hypothetical protein
LQSELSISLSAVFSIRPPLNSKFFDLFSSAKKTGGVKAAIGRWCRTKVQLRRILAIPGAAFGQINAAERFYAVRPGASAAAGRPPTVQTGLSHFETPP